jgi:hypothetical protein
MSFKDRLKREETHRPPKSRNLETFTGLPKSSKGDIVAAPYCCLAADHIRNQCQSKMPALRQHRLVPLFSDRRGFILFFAGFCIFCAGQSHFLS